MGEFMDEKVDEFTNNSNQSLILEHSRQSIILFMYMEFERAHMKASLQIVPNLFSFLMINLSMV